MAWVSPKVYAILSKSEEGKDILEGIADKSQEEVDKEVDAFFGKGGKGYKSNAEYSQAKMDDKAEEERYKSMDDEEVSEKDYEDNTDEDTEEDGSVYEEYNLEKDEIEEKLREEFDLSNTSKERVVDYIRENFGVHRISDATEIANDILGNKDFSNGKVFSSLEEAKNTVSGKKVDRGENHIDYEEDDMTGAKIYRKTTEDNNNVIILKSKENGKYRAFMDGVSVGNGDFASFEEAEKAVNKKRQKKVFEKGEEVEINEGYGSPTKAKILRKMPQKELDDLYYSLNPKAPGGYYEVEEEGFMGHKNKRVVWVGRIDRNK